MLCSGSFRHKEKPKIENRLNSEDSDEDHYQLLPKRDSENTSEKMMTQDDDEKVVSISEGSSPACVYTRRTPGTRNQRPTTVVIVCPLVSLFTEFKSHYSIKKKDITA